MPEPFLGEMESSGGTYVSGIQDRCLKNCLDMAARWAIMWPDSMNEHGFYLRDAAHRMIMPCPDTDSLS